MKANLKRLIKLLLKVFVGLFLLITLILIVISIIGGRHEAATKKLLSQEIVKLPVPGNCSESNRQYQSGGIDTESTWIVKYSCNTTLGSANSYITNSLAKEGYKKVDPNNIDSPYQIDYGNHEFGISYNLDTQSSFNSSEMSGTTPIDSITLQLSRAH